MGVAWRMRDLGREFLRGSQSQGGLALAHRGHLPNTAASGALCTPYQLAEAAGKLHNKVPRT